MKNVFILAGSNGIGKKKICFNLANRLNHNNLYSEIVLFDHINQYKDLNLFEILKQIWLRKLALPYLKHVGLIKIKNKIIN